MLTTLQRDEIEEIEIDLTGVCNLNCYICSRNFAHAQHMVKQNIRPMKDIIAQLDTFKGLKRCMLAGTLSEPTLHPEFLQLIEWLGQKGISYEIFTNGSVHSNKWWKKLGQISTEDSRVIFTVCGSTQELHSKYRVGSDLNELLDHAASFRSDKKNDWCQHILFEYNKEDFEMGKMDKIFSQFSHSFQVQSEGKRRLNSVIHQIPDGVGPVRKIKLLQDLVFSHMTPIGSDETIICESARCKKIYIDQFGRATYCFTHAEFESDYFEDGFAEVNYEPIMNYEFQDCFLCSKCARSIQDKCGVQMIC